MLFSWGLTRLRCKTHFLSLFRNSFWDSFLIFTVIILWFLVFFLFIRDWFLFLSTAAWILLIDLLLLLVSVIYSCGLRWSKCRWCTIVLLLSIHITSIAAFGWWILVALAWATMRQLGAGTLINPLLLLVWEVFLVIYRLRRSSVVATTWMVMMMVVVGSAVSFIFLNLSVKYVRRLMVIISTGSMMGISAMRMGMVVLIFFDFMNHSSSMVMVWVQESWWLLVIWLMVEKRWPRS